MRKLDLILNDIFNSKDYNAKGSAVRVAESFIVSKKSEYYLVCIMEISDFDGEHSMYEYSVYSLTSECYIEKTSELHQELADSFPHLHNIQISGGSVNFLEKRRLSMLFYEIVETIASCENVTVDVLVQYKSYLCDMAKMKSESLQQIYHFFEKMIS